MTASPSNVNRGYPIAFVKHGICAAFDFHDSRYGKFWVDGQNNPGFSGGPVVYHNHATNQITVAGVVSGYRWAEERVWRNGSATSMEVRVNTGLLLAFAIDSAISAIERRPIGPAIITAN